MEVDSAPGYVRWGSARKRAMAISMKQNAAFPYKEYGRTYGKRGNPESFQYKMYGASFKEADATQKQNRKLNGFIGAGKYRGRPMAGFKGAGKYGLNFLSGNSVAVGLPGSRRIVAGNAGAFAGTGDYGPQLTNQIIQGGNAPMMVNANLGDLSGDVTIAHREFCCDITIVNSTGAAISSPFENRTYELNPGLSSTFPWLSQLAANFTMYDLEGLIFEYRPNSGEFGSSASNQLGKVIMATQYDADAPAFATGLQAQNYAYAMSCKPSVGMLHGVESKNSQQALNQYYVRTGVTQKDKVWTDIGVLQVMTEGIQVPANTTSIIGELWVSYKVKLSRANLTSAIYNRDVSADQFVGRSSAASLGGDTVAYSQLASFDYGQWEFPAGVYSGSDFARRRDSSLGGSLRPRSGLATTVLDFTFPSGIQDGVYLIICALHDAGTLIPALLNATLTGTAGVTVNTATDPPDSTGGLVAMLNDTAAPRSFFGGAMTGVSTYVDWNRSYLCRVRGTGSATSALPLATLTFSLAIPNGVAVNFVVHEVNANLFANTI